MFSQSHFQRPRLTKRDKPGLLQHAHVPARELPDVLPPLMQQQSTGLILSPPPSSLSEAETRIHRRSLNERDVTRQHHPRVAVNANVHPSRYDDSLAEVSDFALGQPQANDRRAITMLGSPIASPDNNMIPTSSISNTAPSSTISRSIRVSDCFPPEPQQPLRGDASEPSDERLGQKAKKAGPLRVPEDELRPLFVETYFEHCYTWCPILDPSTIFQELQDSPLLDNAIATLGTNLRPPSKLLLELISAPSSKILKADKTKRLFTLGMFDMGHRLSLVLEK